MDGCVGGWVDGWGAVFAPTCQVMLRWESWCWRPAGGQLTVTDGWSSLQLYTAFILSVGCAWALNQQRLSSGQSAARPRPSPSPPSFLPLLPSTSPSPSPHPSLRVCLCGIFVILIKRAEEQLWGFYIIYRWFFMQYMPLMTVIKVLGCSLTASLSFSHRTLKKMPRC